MSLARLHFTVFNISYRHRHPADVSNNFKSKRFDRRFLDDELVLTYVVQYTVQQGNIFPDLGLRCFYSMGSYMN